MTQNINKNVKAVYFSFLESGSVIYAILADEIEQVVDSMKRGFYVDTDAAKEHDVEIHISFSTQNGSGNSRRFDFSADVIEFAVFEYRDPKSKDYDFNQEAKCLGSFALNLQSVLGKKDYDFYMESKLHGKIDVKTIREAETLWQEPENMHHYLALKLKDALAKKGLKDIRDTDFPDDPKDVHATTRLIGMFLQYTEMVRNPHTIGRRLDLRLR